MKIKFSLKHATEPPVKSLISTELENDQMYIDMGLIDAMALIVGGCLRWSWCGNGIQPQFYPLYAFKSNGQRFALFPKGSTIIFTQDKI